ncbi:outer membrane protein [Pseudomonas saudiphocaensis]|uniref:outer membrane protein n=1 Tax=Pseudomonas saudiphocaensis TaxID=1499686 RepID=UPI000F77DC8F|nr:porin family protein [Pseudomonas saudiphocaensis]
MRAFCQNQEVFFRVTLKATIKDHFSLYVAPGYRFQPNWLAYGKLAYHQMQVDYRDSATGKSSKTFDGVGYGLGLAYALGSNVETGVEAQYIGYQSYRRGIVKAEPSTTQLSWSLTYRF